MASEKGKKDTRAVIESLIEDEIRPALQSHGGDIEFVDYNGGIVSVRLKGACGGCPGALMTLKGFVEHQLKAKVDEVDSVELATF